MTHSAIVLFGHGARDPEWTKPFKAVQARLQRMIPDAIVATAFLEFNEPTLEETIAAIAESGSEKIIIIPLFIAVGVHLKRDLPQILTRLRQRYPAIAINVTPALGEADVMLDAIARWVIQTTSPSSDLV